jgi:hypothetical protein
MDTSLIFIILYLIGIPFAFYISYTQNSACFNLMGVFEKIIRGFFAGLLSINYLIYHFIMIHPYSIQDKCPYAGYDRVKSV